MNLANPPTAIIAADSLMTLGVVSVCHERGVRIGQELSLVGYDDVPAFSLITPPLTVIAHDPERMGTEAFNMMRALLNGHDVESMVLPSFLLVRESTGPCRG
jgi:LacI family transcriptional regulator